MLDEEEKTKRTPLGLWKKRPYCIAPPAIAESCRCFVGASTPEREETNPEGCLQVMGFCLFQKKRKRIEKPLDK